MCMPNGPRCSRSMNRLIGNQKIEVMKKRNELRVEMRKIERMIREANDPLREEAC